MRAVRVSAPYVHRGDRFAQLLHSRRRCAPRMRLNLRSSLRAKRARDERESWADSATAIRKAIVARGAVRGRARGRCASRLRQLVIGIRASRRDHGAARTPLATAPARCARNSTLLTADECDRYLGPSFLFAAAGADAERAPFSPRPSCTAASELPRAPYIRSKRSCRLLQFCLCQY